MQSNWYIFARIVSHYTDMTANKTLEVTVVFPDRYTEPHTGCYPSEMSPSRSQTNTLNQIQHIMRYFSSLSPNKRCDIALLDKRRPLPL
jgi:hypothetical protein